MAFKRGLAYTGIAQPTPPNEVVMDRSPTANDFQSFNIGDIWIVPTQISGPSQEVWVLMSKAQNQAVWVQANSGGAVTYNNHELLVGTGTTTINTINNSTAGLPLLTQGASADPTWGVLQVPAGGTGVSSFVSYAPIIGGTTSTGGLQSVASVGVAGQVLTSRGAGLTPTFQGTGGGGAITNLNILYITTPGAGTYTPTTGMVQCIVECVGGGAGSAGTSMQDLVDPISIQGFGFAGAGYSRKIFTAAQIGASKAYSVGAAGTGGTAPAPNGTTLGTSGGDTTFGGVMTAGGGLVTGTIGGTGGTASGGDINIYGSIGTGGIWNGSVFESSGIGGNSGFAYGTGGPGRNFNTGAYSENGQTGSGYGAGAGAGQASTGAVPGVASFDGGAGTSGAVIITEYIQ